MDLEYTIESEINDLRKTLVEAEKAYYLHSKPVISDSEFDKLLQRLTELEKAYPHFQSDTSPTVRIGSDIDVRMPEREHSIPVLSLDKCYSVNEAANWINKVKKEFGVVDFVMEPKIDGAGVVLYYSNGKLDYALTRGDGFKGNDITQNVKTIRSVPLEIDCKLSVAIRGEIYIAKDDFEKYNAVFGDGLYANPRNLASGSARRLKSSETAIVPLKIFLYEAFIEDSVFKTHIENISFLKNNNFPVNQYIHYFGSKNSDNTLDTPGFFSGSIEDLSKRIEYLSEQRNSLLYEIDGLVLKVNSLSIREAMGFTRHHPRWAIAYKFEASTVETKVLGITVQVGRGGRITPVAELEPILLNGSVISRATLHNQDYIAQLGIQPGDIVRISKRGDVIPAVEEVVLSGDLAGGFMLPEQCPVCSKELVKEGAHLFCKNRECPERVLGLLQFFVARTQMDIETLGDKTLEFLYKSGFVKSISDIYEFDYNKLNGLEGFGDKKVSNIIQSVELSKQKPFKTVLASIGLKDIGEKTATLLVNEFKSIDVILEQAAKRDVEVFTSIDGIGQGIAESVIEQFNDKSFIELIERLKRSGLIMEFIDSEKNENQFLASSRWVVTGSFDNFKPRDKASDLIKIHGGEIMSSVSSKTNYLLCGKDAGSKKDKAVSLGIRIVEEEEFLKMMENLSILE